MSKKKPFRAFPALFPHFRVQGPPFPPFFSNSIAKKWHLKFKKGPKYFFSYLPAFLTPGGHCRGQGGCSGGRGGCCGGRGECCGGEKPDPAENRVLLKPGRCCWGRAGVVRNTPIFGTLGANLYFLEQPLSVQKGRGRGHFNPPFGGGILLVGLWSKSRAQNRAQKNPRVVVCRAV